MEGELVNWLDGRLDDCLPVIFKLLPSAKDQLTFGQVCRKWKGIRRQCWKRLDFTSEPFDKMELNDENLRQLLEQYPYVRSLNVARDDDTLTSDAFAIIAESCRNLEHFSMGFTDLKKGDLVPIANACRKLRSFARNVCPSRSDNYRSGSAMISLVQGCMNLESIELSYGQLDERGRWLKKLHSPLQSLSLHYCCFKTEHLLAGIVQCKATLKKLCLVDACVDDSLLKNYHGLKTIVDSCPGMISFELQESSRDVKPLPNVQYFQPILRWSQLEELSLKVLIRYLVTDGFLASLVTCCPKLRKLELVEAGDPNHRGIRLSETGLSQIGRFGQLTQLRLATYIVTDVVLANLKILTLKELRLSLCCEITDEGCIDILKNCKQLESLDVSYCWQITNRTITVACELLNEDPNRRLAIKATKTYVNLEGWSSSNDCLRKQRLIVKCDPPPDAE